MAGPKKCCRLTKADRHAIQAALDTRGSCRSIAEGLGRSPSTAFCEVKRNRVVKRGPGKGEKAAEVPEDAERGTNENTNGLLRDWFPKGVSLDDVSDSEVQEACDSLNRRPRKRLKWKCPWEVYHHQSLHLL